MINSLALIHPKLYKMRLAVDIALFNVLIHVFLHEKIPDQIFEIRSGIFLSKPNAHRS